MTRVLKQLRNSLFMLTWPLALAIAGCAGVSWFVAAFSPPQKVKALYKPPKGKRFLVFVDDITHPVAYEPLKRQLTERLNKQLLTNKIAGETIKYERLLDLMAATPSFNQLTVVPIGQKLDAELVLYVIIEDFALKESEVSPLWRGTLKTTVRIVDVNARPPTLWPTDRAEGYPVERVQTPSIDEPSPTYSEEVAKMLAEKMADKIAKLFYDHEVPVAVGE